MSLCPCRRYGQGLAHPPSPGASRAVWVISRRQMARSAWNLASASSLVSPTTATLGESVATASQPPGVSRRSGTSISCVVSMYPGWPRLPMNVNFAPDFLKEIGVHVHGRPEVRVLCSGRRSAPDLDERVSLMAALQDGRAPYASTGSIVKVIEKHRQMGLPTVNSQKLLQIGVTESLVPRTLYALEALGFYGESGDITPEFDALRKAHEHDFKPRLAALLREAYAPILEVLDPATATQIEVENAFRGFEPTGQIPRMVQLFIGLMAYAEVMPEVKRRSGPVPGQQAPRAPKNKPTSERGQAARSGQSGQMDVNPEHEHKPGRQAPLPPPQVDGRPVERRDISLGVAGTVTVIVNVQWLDLSDDQFTRLRQLIKDIEALGDSGPDLSGQVEAEAAPISAPAEHRVP